VPNVFATFRPSAAEAAFYDGVFALSRVDNKVSPIHVVRQVPSALR